ncbi:hypothetical protein LTR36_009493 [Oleoguttula mirabilis]|uniref:Dynactin subunit 4 n=1 Tax=Oleoguttula mirabilis TaxID=1507867 RepID=A0AAV9JSY1_9PEZI|nr:hypothetical protein LTR36_009493 [Oleoguttula mirabilis]
MAAAFPYTHYACPCSDLTSTAPSSISKRISNNQPANADLTDDRTFNPHDPRANCALYPLDHLLFCDECDAIRCPKCWTEEIINWYCPTCLFEVPSSAVKSDGNRCSRNCYTCPACTAPLAVAAMPQPAGDYLKPTEPATEAYMLQCGYCDWSSRDLDVLFSKPTKITEQLAKQRKARLGSSGKEASDKDAKPNPVGHDTAFGSLTTFYKAQLSESGDAQNQFANSPYSSPANLQRIMNIYGGLSANTLKKSRETPQPMREARDSNEGFSTYTPDPVEHEATVISKLRSLSWEDTTTTEQRLAAPPNNYSRFADQLWPVATPLRTRKGKRCETCRHLISRPDSKVSHIRYKIRLLAMNNIPRIFMRPLHLPNPPPPNAAFRLRADDAVQAELQPNVAQQYILTIRNPIFETIKVTLATPGTTPGNVASRVTILCPSFPVGPAGDVWDEALSSSTTPASASNDGSRKAAMASLTGKAPEDADRQPEAGKVWDRTRNSTSVIVEIVPGPLKAPPSIVPKTEAELADQALDEDDEVLEVPIYVRAEWETVIDADAFGPGAKDDKHHGRQGEKVTKELAYWCVLGVGKIAE